jgi:hypothetical protein
VGSGETRMSATLTQPSSTQPSTTDMPMSRESSVMRDSSVQTPSSAEGSQASISASSTGIGKPAPLQSGKEDILLTVFLFFNLS